MDGIFLPTVFIYIVTLYVYAYFNSILGGGLRMSPSTHTHLILHNVMRCMVCVTNILLRMITWIALLYTIYLYGYSTIRGELPFCLNDICASAPTASSVLQCRWVWETVRAMLLSKTKDIIHQASCFFCHWYDIFSCNFLKSLIEKSFQIRSF